MTDFGIKIGPNAIPTLWREQYSLFENFEITELAQILKQDLKILFSNKAGSYLKHLYLELKKFNLKFTVQEAAKLTTIFDEILQKGNLSSEF